MDALTPEALALGLCARLLGVSLVVQSAELLVLRPAWADAGVWSFAVLRDDLRAFPRAVGAGLAPLLGEWGFTVVLALRLVAAVALATTGAPLALPVLVAAQLLVGLRWRGAFNGGSDAITQVVLLGVGVAALWPQSRLVQVGALLHIALQTALSYHVAGVVKLKGARWRSGAALTAFVSDGRYQAPALARRLLSRPALACVAAWAVMAFDTLFPLAFLGPTACHVALGLALVFHVTNVWLFGLNRFLLGWAAAWPAVWYVAAFMT